MFRTLVLSAFSMACIGVSVLAYQAETRHAQAIQMAELADVKPQDCSLEGFEIDGVFVGCLQPASYAFNDETPSRLQFFIDEVAYTFGL
ncbi:hypothetical protein AIOL_000747 [Candidatus Rhodobacter oscarellae]|uniref:Uncharacterized protein n=1 Tax=Candidatus Rhodobacter oscarellae TaxID=1675527 RepID=A0A0J9ECX6_9RHOB|nr:hypothetical protein [Candidatus Rhodobacter lobularis]KMW60585.1 hypothetical protein AIOL_000747 [Candidatus Rhodobacter lobularis]